MILLLLFLLLLLLLLLVLLTDVTDSQKSMFMSTHTHTHHTYTQFDYVNRLLSVHIIAPASVTIETHTIAAAAMRAMPAPSVNMSQNNELSFVLCALQFVSFCLLPPVIVVSSEPEVLS